MAQHAKIRDKAGRRNTFTCESCELSQFCGSLRRAFCVGPRGATCAPTAGFRKATASSEKGMEGLLCVISHLKIISPMDESSSDCLPFLTDGKDLMWEIAKVQAANFKEVFRAARYVQSWIRRGVSPGALLSAYYLGEAMSRARGSSRWPRRQ